MKPLLALLLLSLVACSGGSGSSKLASEGTNGGGGSANAPMKASVQSGPFQGQQVLNDIVNSQVRVLVPIGINSMVPVGSYTMGSVTGQVTADANGFKTATLSIPTSWILQSVNLPKTSTLPNGESLSDHFNNVTEAAHTSVNIGNQSSVHLYFSPPYFGVFVQTPFDQGVSRQYAVTLDNSFVVVGYFSTHLATPSGNGGLFLFISLPQ